MSDTVEDSFDAGALDALLEQSYNWESNESTEEADVEEADVEEADVEEEVEADVEAVEKIDPKLEALNAKIDALVAHNERLTQKETEKQIDKLKAARIEAIEFGDISAVDKADAELKSLTQAKETVKVKQEVPDFVQKFSDDNPWFDKDEKMTSFMMRTTRGLVEDDGMNLEDAIIEANKLVQTRFADKIVNPKKKESTVLKNTKESKAKTFTLNDLDSDQRAIWNELKEFMSKEEFLKQMEEQK